MVRADRTETLAEPSVAPVSADAQPEVVHSHPVCPWTGRETGAERDGDEARTGLAMTGGLLPAAATGRAHVLLVEDDLAVGRVVTQFFSDVYDVRQARTGAGALAILRREAVDAVVLDYRLPDLTGLQVLAEIASAWPSLPVVMMTAYGSESLCASAFKLGVRDYFPKPVHLEDLLGAVQGLLSAASGDEPIGQAETAAASQLRHSLPVTDLHIHKAVTLIHQHYWDHLPLGRLAREVGMSKFWLSRRFKAVMGVTFRQYLLRVRLQRAMLLLSNPSLSITGVAHEVGFGDLPRFDKLFRRYTGVAPSVYRAQLDRDSE